jgi:general stress protein YciG
MPQPRDPDTPPPDVPSPEYEPGRTPEEIPQAPEPGDPSDDRPRDHPHDAKEFTSVMETSNEGAARRSSRRGFAAMDPERRREIARRGGASVPSEKRSFAQDRGLAADAGRKGGAASRGGGRRPTHPKAG